MSLTGHYINPMLSQYFPCNVYYKPTTWPQTRCLQQDHRLSIRNNNIDEDLNKHLENSFRRHKHSQARHNSFQTINIAKSKIWRINNKSWAADNVNKFHSNKLVFMSTVPVFAHTNSIQSKCSGWEVKMKDENYSVK